MSNFSVILLTAAPAGQAAEAGGDFVKIDGREALLRSVELFLNRQNIKHIQVVVMSDDLEEAKRRYGPHLSFSGVKLIGGGPRWADQIAAAAAKIPAESTHVIIHDAARPIVPYSDIDALIEEAANEDAVTLVAPVRAELIQIDDMGHRLHHWRADEFMHILTPQVFSKQRFEAMVANKESFPPVRARLLKGSPLNIRLRGTGDASLGKAMMALLPKPKIKPPSSPFEEAQW